MYVLSISSLSEVKMVHSLSVPPYIHIRPHIYLVCPILGFLNNSIAFGSHSYAEEEIETSPVLLFLTATTSKLRPH